MHLLLKNKAITRNIIAGSMFVALNVLYIISNGSCPYSYEDPNVCIGYFRKMYPIWLLETIIVGVIWTLIAILTIHKVFSRLCIPCCFLNAVFIFFYKSGLEMKDHGGLNRFTFIMTILVLFFVYGMVRSFIKLWKLSKLLFIAAISGIIFSFWLFYSKRIRGSCGVWEEGLGGHRIDNSGGQCKVPIPTMCELGIRNNWLDFSRYTPT